MENGKLIQICRDRKELDFLYEITKRVAETDSIGEGWGYCDEYIRDDFNKALRKKEDHNEGYLRKAGVPIYELYLKQIKVL